MQLYEPRGQRKYLTPLERDAFLRTALASAPEVRTFWETLAYTGCRISEALAMDPSHIDLEGGVLFLETLKKRRTGVYRAVPVPGPFLKRLDLVHNVRTTQQDLREGSDSRLWGWSGTTAWRRVREVMRPAGMAGLPTTPTTSKQSVILRHSRTSEQSTTIRWTVPIGAEMPALNRRDLFRLGAAGAAAAAQQRKDRPNILFLMTDQQRGDCIGADGNRAIKTPNLDRLAAEGARFRCAYSSTPSCTPARAALLTGLSPWHHGMVGYSRVAERYPFEKPRVLSDAGYYTQCIGKNHFHHQRNTHGYHHVLLDESGRERTPGFRSDYRSWFWSQAPNLDPDATGIGWNDYPAKEYALPERLHPTQWTGESAVRFLKTYERPEPFFLKVSFARPHSPYDPPGRVMREFKDADLPAPHVGDWAERYRQRSSDKPSLWHGDLGAAQVRHSRQGYYGSIRFIDEQIGRILEALHQRGMYDETLIVFLSDHGDMTGDHHLWRKCYAYEPSARVPMLVRWPTGLAAAERGQVFEQPVELRDALPTFLDAAGVEAPPSLDGRSLLDLVRGKGDDWREYIDLEHNICYSPKNHWSALTDGKTKYIYHALDGEEQLFDMRNDPGEEQDLAGDNQHSEELSKWRSRLIDHFQERGEPFLKGGALVPRPESYRHSPNYPDSAA